MHRKSQGLFRLEFFHSIHQFFYYMYYAQYISINFPLHKQSENPWMCYCSRLYPTFAQKLDWLYCVMLSSLSYLVVHYPCYVSLYATYARPPLSYLPLSFFYYAQWLLWQYGLWSFQTGGRKLERFLPKNQHTHRKFLNFENCTNREPQ